MTDLRSLPLPALLGEGILGIRHELRGAAKEEIKRRFAALTTERDKAQFAVERMAAEIVNLREGFSDAETEAASIGNELKASNLARHDAEARVVVLEEALQKSSGGMHKADDPGHVWIRFPQEAWDALTSVPAQEGEAS